MWGMKGEGLVSARWGLEPAMAGKVGWPVCSGVCNHSRTNAGVGDGVSSTFWTCLGSTNSREPV